SAGIRDGISEKLIEKEIEEIVYNFVDKYLTEELFETEKQKALAKIELHQDSPNSMQMLVLTNVCNGRSVKELKDLKNIIERITFKEAKKISKLLLKKENKILQIYTHPKSK
ncbi:MAG: hypothetical protein LBU35_00235, partial [Holosporales bacterium]|nr:hypothetical protein [Holosporales bacterium]